MKNIHDIEQKCMPELEELEESVAIEEIDQDQDRVRQLAIDAKDAFLKSDDWNEIDYSLLELAAENGDITILKQLIKELNEK